MLIDKSKVNLLECDIESYIYQNPHVVRKIYEGIDIKIVVSEWLHRQFTIPSGIIDLLGTTDTSDLAVAEIKLGAIDGKAIAQVCRYAADISDIAGMAAPTKYVPTVYKFVIGNSIDDKSLFECEAMDVTPLIFSVSLELSVSEIGWTSGVKEGFSSMKYRIAKDEKISGVVNAWTKRNRDFFPVSYMDDQEVEE